MIMLNVCSCFSDLIIINISSIRLLSIRFILMFCALFVINLICIDICIHLFMYVVFFLLLCLSCIVLFTYYHYSDLHFLSICTYYFYNYNFDHSPSLPC